jgi:hypothetical protein
MKGGKFQRRWASGSGISRVEPREEAAPEGAPLGGNRAEAIQRLQVGLFGLGSMVLLIGLASVIGSQADLVEESAVPEAAPTTEPTAAPQQRDPLADAGIVPGNPTEPSPAPPPTPAASPTATGAAPTDTPPPPASRVDRPEDD